MMKKTDHFIWSNAANEAFEAPKKQLAELPILASLIDKEPQLLYVAANNKVTCGSRCRGKTRPPMGPSAPCGSTGGRSHCRKSEEHRAAWQQPHEHFYPSSGHREA